MMSFDNKIICVDYLFRGREHRITYFTENKSCIKLEIEDKISLNEWSGSFTCEYVEELTKKTGNFKSFEIFSAMLQSVLVENNEAVSLDLMTYNDLEELRKLKLGSITGSAKPTQQTNSDVAKMNKRYLILTYTTAFDKIHYPLPLVFQGVPDIRQLKQMILELRQKGHTVQQNGGDYEKFEIGELKKKILQLKTENDQLVSTLQKYKTQLQNAELGEEAVRELKAVRSIARSMEEELAEEKTRHQRILMKKNREIKQLTDEVMELKAAKRNLNFRVSSMSQELAIYKRQRQSSRTSTHSPRPPICPPARPLSVVVSPRPRRSRQQTNSDPETRRPISSRSSSLGRDSLQQRFLASSGRRCVSADRYRSNSPTMPKFNPTAYVEKKKLQRREIEEKRRRQIRSRFQSGSDRSRDSSPAGSLRGVGRLGSVSSGSEDFGGGGRRDWQHQHKQRTGLSSEDDSSLGSNSEARRQRQRQKRRAMLDSGEEEDGNGGGSTRLPSKRTIAAPSPPLSVRQKPHSHYRHPAAEDVNDIDRRLNALQDFFQKYLHNE